MGWVSAGAAQRRDRDGGTPPHAGRPVQDDRDPACRRAFPWRASALGTGCHADKRGNVTRCRAKTWPAARHVLVASHCIHKRLHLHEAATLVIADGAQAPREEKGKNNCIFGEHLRITPTQRTCAFAFPVSFR